jgi:5-formyltetrahydrofolate cyclo-ligase
MTDHKRLRQQLRRARRALPSRQRALATDAALDRVRRLPRYLHAACIALYAGADGEICPLPLVKHAIDLGKTACLPVLHPFRDGQLLFCTWRHGDRLRRNRFGIAEPVPTARNLISARQLDLVITPLLGFDDQGHRLGMGGGFYDRTFAFLRRHSRLQRPFMLGLAYEFQKVEALHTQPWDVPLNAVVTDTTSYRFRNLRS